MDLGEESTKHLKKKIIQHKLFQKKKKWRNTF